MLRYRVRTADGRRVENTLPVGFLRDFPSEKAAWREVDRLGLNPYQQRRPCPRSPPVRLSLRAIPEERLWSRCCPSQNGAHRP